MLKKIETNITKEINNDNSLVYCKLCVINNKRPVTSLENKNFIGSQKKTTRFTDGICDASIAVEKKNKINWKDRELELLDLCDKFRKTNGDYDCLVPGSGGKDSFYTSYKLKYEYGMNPLTITYAPHIYTDWGYKNFKSWIDTGFDNFLFTPNTKVHRLLTRLALENLFHHFPP